MGKNLNFSVIIFFTIFGVATLFDFLFSDKISVGVNLILASLVVIFSLIKGYYDSKHVCEFNIPCENIKVNEMIRDLTFKCKCGEIHNERVHVDSVTYKKFIKEIK